MTIRFPEVSNLCLIKPTTVFLRIAEFLTRMSISARSVRMQSMDDYDAIKETIYHYFDGSKTKDRTRLERAFAVDIAHIKGYAKNESGYLELSSLPIKDMIDIWVSDDTPPAQTGFRQNSFHSNLQ
jgi:hypothetical protein